MATRDTSMDIPSIAFGFTLGFFVLTGSKVTRQAITMYKRTRRFWNPYPWMCTIELFINLIFAVVTWLHLRGDIPISFASLFAAVVLWTVQTQLILQIIANRVALVVHERSQGTRLKWALFFGVGVINISVFCIWIPARLEISEAWIRVNNVWDRISKVIFLLIDLVLNAYFLWLVRSGLISKGLKKYKTLFNFNATIVVVSISMDVLLIAMMSLRDSYIYVQFNSVAYMVKLNIECSMADLISKVVHGKADVFDPSSNIQSISLPVSSYTCTGNFKSSKHATYSGRRKADPDEISLENDEEAGHGDNGIMKTITTTVVRDEGTDDRESVSSSVVQLNDEYRVGTNSNL